MKELEIAMLSHLHQDSSMTDISASLDTLIKHPIVHAPWKEFPYLPEVSFSIAHHNNCIFIKYNVFEAVVKAAWYKSDDPVYKDSCVEFFISMDEMGYYNFEFNAIGTCKLNFGTDRHNRKVISDKVVNSIRYLATLQNKIDSDSRRGVHWELVLMIPLEAFAEHHLTSLSGKRCAANFYKCGDDLPVPHYVCWNDIQTPSPDFHRPEYFGRLVFL
ncbi:MAG: hypothetical protein JNM57_02200 [Cyclobacteriaceae bacterium]|nr:hypothetical protein [Cyclobacteriaceae bacterium]